MLDILTSNDMHMSFYMQVKMQIRRLILPPSKLLKNIQVFTVGLCPQYYMIKDFYPLSYAKFFILTHISVCLSTTEFHWRCDHSNNTLNSSMSGTGDTYLDREASKGLFFPLSSQSPLSSPWQRNLLRMLNLGLKVAKEMKF